MNLKFQRISISILITKKMKSRLTLLLISFLCLTGLPSCQDMGNDSETPQSVSLLTVPGTAVSAAGGIKSVTIVATSKWTASSDSDWITLDKSSGEKGMQAVVLTYDVNATGAPRTGNVTFKAGEITDTFVLTQSK